MRAKILNVQKRKNAVDWPLFASPSDDYRNMVLLQVVSKAWGGLRTYSEPDIYFLMARSGLRELFRWLCANIPAAYVVGPDGRREMSYELAREFLRFLLPEQAVQQAEQDASYLTAPCGPMK